MPDKRIKVVVVDDSALMRMLIPTLLEKTGEITVVATASDPLIARRKIKETNPDVITLDVEMPNMDGLSFLEKIMTLRPTPVVMVSSLTRAGAEITLKALELGAVDFVAKPAIDLEKNMHALASTLIEKVKIASTSNVRKRPRGGTDDRDDKSDYQFSTTESLIAIGASTGGVQVIGRLLEKFPANAPGTVITQHMPPSFTSKFADRLDGLCKVKVREAENGRRIRPGEVWIAPGNTHLLVERNGADYVCRLSDAPPVNGHRPSVDVLFHSVARACGDRAVGVILTGMGRDGAEGLLEMHQAGAVTCGQDEATSTVYGMPRVAHELGAVDVQLPEKKVFNYIMAKTSNDKQKIRI